MADTLAGQHVLITGGGSGIGFASAVAFVADGASVSIVGRNAEKLERAAAELAVPDRVHVFTGDVGDESQLAAIVTAANEIAPLTVALANAGTGDIAPLMVTEDDNWQKVLQTNLAGTFYTFKHAAKAIAKAGGGAMCAISSIAGVRTHRFMHAYCVSKAGIDMLVRTTADELGVAGIRVNSVCPGLVDTEIAKGLFAHEQVHQDYLDCMPLGLSVDGGHHLRRGPDYEPISNAAFGADITRGIV
ncbi:MAG: SDR family NAD(P)-dependent oxidoreductase [Gammaproteobacteria bacterium]|nr:SDR family NAD(P)-dependent oxidoreductase [Gammaproteobacteria bacterium]